MREEAIIGKQEMRKRLAVLSFSEKIKILEKLRERDKAIATGGLSRKTELLRGDTPVGKKKD
jgi:hypothetical protein